MLEHEVARWCSSEAKSLGGLLANDDGLELYKNGNTMANEAHNMRSSRYGQQNTRHTAVSLLQQKNPPKTAKAREPFVGTTCIQRSRRWSTVRTYKMAIEVLALACTNTISEIN